MSTKWLVLLLAIGCSGTSKPAAPEPGKVATAEPRLIQVGLRTMHVDCKGSGGPTLVIDADLGESSASEQVVTLAARARRSRRVCVYDRAGLGASEPDPMGPRSLEMWITDLEQALRAAGETGPIELVATGLATYSARLMASRYPGRVVRLTLTAPVHLGMEPGLMALLDDTERQRWLATAQEREPIDYERSIELVQSMAPLDGVEVVVQTGPVEIVGLPAKTMTRLTPQIEQLIERLVDQLGAKRSPSP